MDPLIHATAPVSNFHLELFGGKKGLIEPSSGFCAHPEAQVKLTAHGGKAYDSEPVVASSCAEAKRRSQK